MLLFCASSIKEKPLPYTLAVFGEVGLSGEIRPVPNGQERLKEAVKTWLYHAVVPQSQCPKTQLEQYQGLNIIAVERLDDAIDGAFNYL